jgi:hypothetical protein
MNEERFSQFLREIEAERIPASIDLWPQIQVRIESEPSKGAHRMRRTVVSLVAVVLLLILGSILVFPPVRIAAAQAIREIESFVVGMAGGPSGPESYSPPPPFTVKLPGYLPKGFRYVGGEFNPGGNLVSVSMSAEVVQLPVEEMEGTQTQHEVVDQSLIPKVERDRSLPFIVARYHDNDKFYIEIFERQALTDEELPSGDERIIASQPARLQKSELALILTWIDEGTWIELRSNLPEDEVLKVAEELVIIQEAGETDEGLSQSPHIQINEEFTRDNNYCRPNDGPPSVGGLLLGEVAGQKNFGSVWINFHDRDFFPETVAGGSNVPNMHEGVYLPALEALRNPDLEMRRLPYKSVNVFEGTEQGCQTAPYDLQGYIVIEVWENQTNIGYGGEGHLYVQRAIKAIEKELEDSKN